jgi:hypothetical protein
MQTILFLDDFRFPQNVFPRAFCRENQFTVCRTVSEAWQAVRNGRHYDMWSLDHDMLPIMQKEGEDHLYPPSGYAFLLMVQINITLVHWPKGQVFVHSANPWGAERMRKVIAEIDNEI